MRAWTTVYDLPKDILSTLRLKAEIGSEHIQEDIEIHKSHAGGISIKTSQRCFLNHKHLLRRTFITAMEVGEKN